MTTLLAVVTGGLYAAGLYMVLRRSIVKLILGLALLSHAAHLLIFTAGRPRRGGTPFIPEGADEAIAGSADPLPQALILTAIVISFGVLAFALALVHRAHQSLGTDDLDDMRATDT